MRKALPCLPRHIQYRSEPLLCLRHSFSSKSYGLRHAPRQPFVRPAHVQYYRRSISSLPDLSVQQDDGRIPRLSEDAKRWDKPRGNKSRNPLDWAAEFDRFLPSTVKGVLPAGHLSNNGNSTPVLELAHIETITNGARKRARVNIFAWMIENGYEGAAVWLITECLRQLAAGTRVNSTKPPSNIHWPDDLFVSLRPEAKRAVDPWLSYTPSDTIDSEAAFENNQFLHQSAGLEYAFLNMLWDTLGRLVLRCTDMKEGDAADVMSSVLLILGHIHNLGMIPDDIYAYKPLTKPTFSQRPPILHMVSSRILASMSDAVWRKQQDGAIAEATARGLTFKQISESVPGGRFRLKVSPLAPEIWLELILWCCVDGGYRGAAVAIIKSLREHQKDPWFAMRWTSPQYAGNRNARIDWDRVKLRHGGTVGLIEGYSREKPFVDVPPRTISVEVVLAVLESCINSCDVSSDRISGFRHTDATIIDIENIVAFLEPHDLPPEYLDFVGNRLVQTGTFDSARSPATSLQRWTTSLSNMQQLETIGNTSTVTTDLSLNPILSHSQQLSGLQHQALDGLVQLGDVHSALQLFNDIQEKVDKNKLRSITEFLQMQPAPEKGFFSPRPFPYRAEYTESYGQLPYYKLAAFLGLLSDTKMTGLGQWLLYADDLDGALIPKSAYGHSSMIAALLNFASVSQDEDLRHEVLRASHRPRVGATVRVMRSIVNGLLSILDFDAVRIWLTQLRQAEGGGPGLTNIVHLAATILRLENGIFGKEKNKEIQVERACSILKDILESKIYGNINRDFTVVQQNLFKQQIGHILRVFAFTDRSVLEHFARTYVNQYRTGNVVSLPANHFNVLLSAVVDVHGCTAGREMWSLFCQDFDVSEMARSEMNDGDIDTDVDEDIPQANGEGAISREHEKLQYDDLNTAVATDMDVPFETAMFPQSSTEDNLAPLLKPMTITEPNLQTARIIIRAAIKEKQARRRRGKTTEVQDDILAWAYLKLKVFSAAENAMIEQEIQEPVAGLALSIEKQIALTRRESSTPSERWRRIYGEGSMEMSSLWAPGRPRAASPGFRAGSM